VRSCIGSELPDKFTKDVGAEESFELIATFARNEPSVAGVKLTSKVQVLPAAIVGDDAPQGLDPPFKSNANT
jgi:hypothetical protein